MKKVLAFDFGASSGRAILGEYSNHKITLTEIHRFSNDPVLVNGTLYWDILRLFHEVKESIIKCIQMGHADIESIGIDTWGVDFGLLDKQGFLLENPVHYRDQRTHDLMDEVIEKIGKKELYHKTGIQFMNFNTIFQLYSLKKNRPDLLKSADKIVFISDLIGYFLTGVVGCEYTIASTSGLLNVETRAWDNELIDTLELPRKIFSEITQPGTKLGVLRPDFAKELGIQQIEVIMVAGHDTASAVLATPLSTTKSAYISCGTWSLIGKELNHPIVNEKAFRENYTNEGGYNYTTRFIKNICGLWLIQEAKKDWERQGLKISYDIINHSIKEIKENHSFINPDYKEFASPSNMIKKLINYLKETNQTEISSIGEIALCIYESLALTYRNKIEVLESITNEEVDSIHIVGGGAQSEFLCQFTANATNKIVYAGPYEATAIGNVVVQLISKKIIPDLQEAREIIYNGFGVKVYQPYETEKWNEKYSKYLTIIKL